MSLYICSKCGTIENSNLITRKNKIEGYPNYSFLEMVVGNVDDELNWKCNLLCSECNSGTWHGEFDKREPTNIEKRMQEQMLKQQLCLFTQHAYYDTYVREPGIITEELLDSYENDLVEKEETDKISEEVKRLLKNRDWMYSSHDPYVREEPKIGRNELCSCGSGKKYKRCCINISPN